MTFENHGQQGVHAELQFIDGKDSSSFPLLFILTTCSLLTLWTNCEVLFSTLNFKLAAISRLCNDIAFVLFKLTENNF